METVQINATIPTSIDAERSILGAILLDNNALNEATGQIDAADFSLDSHRRIFARMVEMALASKPIDSVTLIEELDRAHDLARVGDVGYIADLMAGVPERPSIQAYIDIVKGHAHGRTLLFTSKRSIEQIVDGEPVKDVAGGMLQAVLNVEEESTRSRTEACKDFISGVLQEIETQSASDGLIGLPTGLHCLDNATGGLRPGELIVIGARPGAGKSALAGQIAITNAGAGTPAIFFSLEMSKSDLGRRFLSAVSSVPAFMVRDPKWLRKNDPRWRDLASAAGRIAEWPLYVDDNGSLTVNEIMARAKLFIARHGVKLVIVDYLQLVRADVADIRERVGRVADQLRILAKTERVPVVLLSQLRRPERFNAEPTLIELKESGDIEAHAHVVLLIHSPVGPDMRPMEQEIIIAKNRNGVMGREGVVLDTDKLLFYSRTDAGEQREWREAPRSATPVLPCMAMA
jgi:replicative DNA helicase